MKTNRELALGLAILAVAGALSQFVFIGLLGFVLFPVAFVLLFKAQRGAGSPGISSPTSTVLLPTIGAGLITYAAYRAGALAYAVAIHRIHPGSTLERATAWGWGLSFALGVGGGVLVIGGIARALNWPATQRFAWYGAAIAVHPATAALFFLLASRLPYTA
ncbi:MAG: hypothetical protein FIB06_09000 [Betaproteobacteria bacterium]|nr:hypothetical protein [Betaproteobacteria bacterium]